MAVMRANTLPQVGYRDYGSRDAYAAAHLSGMGTYFYNRPFDPAELYADTNPHRSEERRVGKECRL